VLKLNARSVVYPTRRAQCNLQTLKPERAVADFRKIIALEPKNTTVKQQLEATQKLVRKIEFEKVGQPGIW
jgi:serine/threonine-protein phosphatase 5